MKFERDMTGVEVLKGDIYFVAFQDANCPTITNFIRYEAPTAETTLAMETAEGDMTFLILEGDFRQQYLQAANEGGLEACLDVYHSYRDKFSSQFSGDDQINKRVLH
jgi:hypothetical protein